MGCLFCGYVSTAQVANSDRVYLQLSISLLMLLMVSSGTRLVSVKPRAYECNLRKLNLLSRWKMKPPFTAEILLVAGMFCSPRWDSELDVLGLGRQSYFFELLVLKLFVTFSVLMPALLHSDPGDASRQHCVFSIYKKKHIRPHYAVGRL